MKKKMNIQKKYACILTVPDPLYPDLLYPIDALDILLELQYRK